MRDRAAIYARFSSDKQKSESIEQQERVCRDYCAKMGYDVGNVYCDMAMSGRSDDRPSFQRMIGEGSFYDVVVVYKFDRFARNRYDSAKYKRDLKESGCRLESATESMGDGIESIILESLFEGMAEYYSAQLSQNTTRGMRDNAMKCKVNGMLPYGYRNDNGFYAVDEREAHVVRKVFEIYASSEPYDFDAEFGMYLTRRGKPFTRSQISQMVRNERYRGVYEWGGTRIEDGIPRIVSDELWFAAQARRNRRRRRTMRERMCLTGKLFGRTGEHSQSQGTKSKYGEYQYYVVDGEYIERKYLEHLVASSIRECIRSEEAAREIASVVLKAQDEQHESDGVCDVIQGQIDALERQRANYVKTIGMIGPDAGVLQAMGEIDVQLESLRSELACEQARIAARLDEGKVRFVLEKMSECESDAELIDHWLSFALVFEDHVTVYCHWDRLPATNPTIQGAITSDDRVRLGAKWCPECEIARTCTSTALVIVASRTLPEQRLV